MTIARPVPTRQKPRPAPERRGPEAPAAEVAGPVPDTDHRVDAVGLGPDPADSAGPEAAPEAAEPASLPPDREEAERAEAAPPLPQPPSAERVPLPHAKALTDRFSTPPPVEVYSGPNARATLDALGAEAATVDGRILLREPEPPLEVITHEMVHAEQQRRTPESPADAVLAPTASAEVEAEAIAARLPGEAPEAVGAPAAPTSIALNRAERVSDDPQTAFRARRDEGRAERPGPGARSEAPAPGEERAPVAPTGRREETPAPEGSGGGGASPEEALLDRSEAPPPVEAASVELPTAEPLAAADVRGAMDEFVRRTPTEKAVLARGLGASLQGKADAEQTAFNASVPEFHATLDGEDLAPLPEGVEAPKGVAGPLEAQAPGPPPEPVLAETPDPGDYDANDGIASSFRRLFGGADEASRAEQIAESLDQVRTTDPEVSADAGPPPAIPLEGETDPARMGEQAATGRTQAMEGRAAAAQAVVNGPGPEVVQPVVLDEAYAVPEAAPVALEMAPPGEGVDTYLQAELPQSVRDAVDAQQGETMEASLEESRLQIATATEERDARRDEELAEAEAQNRALVDDAQRQQNEEVEARRAEIQAGRENTLRRQQEAVDEVNADIDAEREDSRGEIDDRVEEDQARIESEYDRAETQAQAEIDAGEEEAERERQEAEREAEDKSWWEEAVDWVAERLSDLADAINAIFDAVREAVKGILDAVKELAHAIIDLAADFIKGVISAYGELVKGLVDGLLGEIFPELAAALTELIDAAVAAAHELVDAVAEGLKSAVDALVDTVFAAFDAILSAYQLAVNAALALATAVITGDWSEALRIILEAVLQVAGIDKEQFYAFVGRAEETFQIIVDDPGAFVGNLIDAFVQGVNQFGTNFLDWLQRGIIAWLTGSLPDIQMPETWDFWGVLDLVRQVLGLTYERMRERAVAIIGETAVQVIEFVASYLQTLIEGGWRALFERIQEDLSNLASQILTGIGTMIVESVVTAAITRLATMFNPVGAIVNLILTAWNFYTFLRDQLQRIYQIVTGIVDAIGDIARGVLQPAADRVESTLGSLLPLAIDLLARLLGLGNLPQRVRGIIEDVRGMVDRAIDNLINRIRGLFSGAGEEPVSEGGEEETGTPNTGEVDAAGTEGVIGQHEHFDAAGRHHELWVSGEQGDDVVMASETPRSLGTLRGEWEASLRALPDDQEGQPPRKVPGLAAVGRIPGRVSTVLQKAEVARPRADYTPPAGAAADLDAARNALIADVQIVLEALGLGPVPNPDARFLLVTAEEPFRLADRSPAVFADEAGNPLPRSSRAAWTKEDYIAAVRRLPDGGTNPESAWAWDRAGGSRGREAYGIAKVETETSNRYALVSPYHEVVQPVGSTADTRLGYINHDNVLPFLRAMALGSDYTIPGAPERSNVIRASEFPTLYANSPDRSRIASVLRARVRGQHEWIPVSAFGEVVGRAAEAAAATSVLEANVIVHLADTLRTETSNVVFKPVPANLGEVDGKKVMNGHSGAVYLNGSPLTARQPTFHQELERTVLGAAPTAEAITSGLKSKAAAWVWNTEPVDVDRFHPAMRFEPGHATLATRKDEQPQKYQTVMDGFDDGLARARRDAGGP